MWYKSSGYLKYYPYGDWWVILYCCDDLIEYYRYMLQREKGIKLHSPKHGSHISVVRGEGEPKYKERWKLKEGEFIDFEYNHELVFGDTHVWLRIQSEELLDLRRQLGLEKEQPPFGFHLTIGRFTE